MPYLFYSQGYLFDYKCSDVETQLKGSYKGNTRTNFIYLNSKDSTIIAYDYFFNNAGNSLWIYDFKNNSFLNFDKNKSTSDSKLKIVNVSKIKKYKDEIDIKSVEILVDKGLYKVFTYDNEKKEIPNLYLEIELVDSDFPLQRIRFMDVTLNIHNKIYDALMEKLPSQYFRIKTVKTDYKNGVIMLDDYSNCSKVDTYFNLSK